MSRSPPGQPPGRSQGTPPGRSAPLPGGCGSVVLSPPCPTAPCCRSGCAAPRCHHHRTEPHLCLSHFPASSAAFWARCLPEAPRCPPAPSRSPPSGRRTLRDAGSRTSPPGTGAQQTHGTGGRGGGHCCWWNWALPSREDGFGHSGCNFFIWDPLEWMAWLPPGPPYVLGPFAKVNSENKMGG